MVCLQTLFVLGTGYAYHSIIFNGMFVIHFVLGSGYAYHGITFGLYVDSLLTKADPKHRRVDQIFKEEIGDKFGIMKFESNLK